MWLIRRIYCIITARIRRMGEGNIFNLFVSPHPGGYPNPRFFPRCLVPGPSQKVPQSQILSQVFGLRSQDRGTPHQDWSTPWPGLWSPPGRLRCGRYASCGFPQGDFLVFNNFTNVIFIYLLEMGMILCQAKNLAYILDFVKCTSFNSLTEFSEFKILFLLNICLNECTNISLLYFAFSIE